MSRWTCGGLDAVPPWVRTEVSRVDVFRGAVAVWKSEAINFSSNVNWLEELVRRSEKPESWLYLSEYLDRRAGLLDRALDAARRGAQLEPWNAWFQVRIGEILKKMGDREGAIAAARSTAALERQWHPDQPNPFFEQFLNRILGSA
jgi:predicted Zn-dependent protease